jgi:hypothetical protein
MWTTEMELQRKKRKKLIQQECAYKKKIINYKRQNKRINKIGMWISEK